MDQFPVVPPFAQYRQRPDLLVNVFDTQVNDFLLPESLPEQEVEDQ
jgi:hypothetical protein